MTGKDIIQARAVIGHRWGFKRPLKSAELARVLSVSPQRIAAWESGRAQIGGSALAFLRALQAGAMPADSLDTYRTPSPHQ